MHQRSIRVYDRFLGAMSVILARAEAHCRAARIPPEALLGFRLYPDMFPLTRQVQLACDFAARGGARLAGAEPRAFPDTETDFDGLQARIAAVRAYLAGFGPEALAGAETRAIRFRMAGQEVTLSGEDYLDLYSLPQFHFHLTTAYAILRHNGLPIGKRDYMGAA